MHHWLNIHDGQDSLGVKIESNESTLTHTCNSDLWFLLSPQTQLSIAPLSSDSPTSDIICPNQISNPMVSLHQIPPKSLHSCNRGHKSPLHHPTFHPVLHFQPNSPNHPSCHFPSTLFLPRLVYGGCTFCSCSCNHHCLFKCSL